MSTPNENNETKKNKTPKTERPMFWMRTIEGRKNRLAHEYRASLGATAREGISDEDYATTMATLEQMARNLGWDETQPDERGFGRGFGPGFGHGFGPHFGHGHHHHDGPHAHRGHGRGRKGKGRRDDHDATLPIQTPEA